MDQVSESQPSESQISGQDSSEEYKHDVIVIETDSATEEEEEEEEEQEEPGQVSVFSWEVGSKSLAACIDQLPCL